MRILLEDLINWNWMFYELWNFHNTWRDSTLGKDIDRTCDTITMDNSAELEAEKAELEIIETQKQIQSLKGGFWRRF